MAAVNMAAAKWPSGSFWHKVTAMDKLLWDHIIREILLLVLLVLSAFPVLMNKMVLYIVYIYIRQKGQKRTKNLSKKGQLDAGSLEGLCSSKLFRTEQNISQSVKELLFSLKQHCAAVLECSASLTEWQSNATLWIKLCLISSWMPTSQIETHGEAKQEKLKKNRKIQKESQKQAAHSSIPWLATHRRLKYNVNNIRSWYAVSFKRKLSLQALFDYHR